MILELEKYLEAVRADYANEGFNPGMTESFNSGLTVKETALYWKVIASRSVHSFIVKEDGAQFKRGDILKAASWKAPAKNKARGNIFGTYHINWTGPDYLK